MIDKNFYQEDNLYKKNNCSKKYYDILLKLKNKINKYKKKLSYKNKIIKKLENNLLKFKEDIENLNLRFRADIENIHKRNQLNIENIYKYSLEKFIKNILPVIDNLKNALKVSKNKNLDNKITYEGIKLTLKNFLSVIKNFGISIINKINIEFDPNFYQAVSVIETNNIKENNIIVEILQDGYILNNRLLRPAMVKVMKYQK